MLSRSWNTYLRIHRCRVSETAFLHLENNGGFNGIPVCVETDGPGDALIALRRRKGLEEFLRPGVFRRVEGLEKDSRGIICQGGQGIGDNPMAGLVFLDESLGNGVLAVG